MEIQLTIDNIEGVDLEDPNLTLHIYDDDQRVMEAHPCMVPPAFIYS